MKSVRRKNGAAIGRENVAALRSYLARTPVDELPRNDAGLNKTLIGKACGFDRQVFRSNAACRELLEAAESSLAEYIVKVDPAVAEPPEDKVKAQEAKIEQKYLVALADNAALRKENERLRALKKIMVESGKLPWT